MIGSMKDELRLKIMTEFLSLTPKTYSFLMDEGNSNKKAKETENVQWKQYLKLMIIKIAY